MEAAGCGVCASFGMREENASEYMRVESDYA